MLRVGFFPLSFFSIIKNRNDREKPELVVDMAPARDTARGETHIYNHAPLKLGALSACLKY